MTPVKSSRRIKSESTFEFTAPNRDAALVSFKTALDQVCTGHPEVLNHRISVDEGELSVTLEVEAANWSSADETVREVMTRAVELISGRIVSEPEPASRPLTSATFEQLGTYLVPA